MIEKDKKYKTKSGKEVKVFDIVGQFAYCMVRDTDDHAKYEWEMVVYHTKWHTPSRTDQSYRWVEEYRLVEVKETREVDNTIYLYDDGIANVLSWAPNPTRGYKGFSARARLIGSIEEGEGTYKLVKQ